MVVGWQEWRESMVGYLIAVALNLAMLWVAPGGGERARSPLPIARTLDGWPPADREPCLPYRLEPLASTVEPDRARDRSRASGQPRSIEWLRRSTYPLGRVRSRDPIGLN